MSTSTCDLPHDILAFIFQKLPLSSICECRAVCKEWNSLIMSAEFSPLSLPQFKRANCQKPMLVENDHVEGCSMRVYKNDSWISISLPFLADVPPKRPLYLTASSDGLMCFETDDRKSFIICNPITKKWRHLQLPVAEEECGRRVCSCLNPTFCTHWQGNMPDTLTGLVVYRHRGNYKLIVASLAESRERRTFIYDSLEHFWTTGAQVPEGKGFVNPVALTVKGNLYCLIEGLDQKLVAKYDTKCDIWCCTEPLVGKDVLPHLHDKNEPELIEHHTGVKLLARNVDRLCGYRPFYNVGGIESRDTAIFSVFETPGGIEILRSQRYENMLRDLIVKRRLECPWVYFQVGRLDEMSSYEGDGDCLNYAKWHSLASAYSAAYAGHGDTIYALGCIDTPSGSSTEARMFHVLKVNCGLCYVHEMITLLSGFRRADSPSDKQIELRLFEPSLTAQV